MAQDRIDNYRINAPKHIDQRALKNGNTPYATKQEAHDSIAYKYLTQTVSVLKAGIATEYWYRDAFASVDDLIEKIPDVADVDLTDIQSDIDTKAQLPDGLSVIGTVQVAIDVATISGFEGIYNGNHINLPAATIQLDPKDTATNRQSYDRYDTIYFNPANSTYGKLTGDAVENPVKPIKPAPTGTFLIANVRRNADGTNVVVPAPLNGYVTLDGVQTISSEKRFDDGISTNKELLPVRKPINTFFTPAFYVNYENVYHNNSVSFVDDSLSFFKKVIKIPQGMSRLQPHAIYGPYENGFPAGDWVYSFRLKVSDNTITDDVIGFDIAVGGEPWVGHTLNIKPSSFPNTTDYKTFSVPFTATKGTNYEFRIHILPDVNPINFYFDYGIATRPVVAAPTLLNDATDVIITSPSSGQVLKYNGVAWVNGIDEIGDAGADGDMFKTTYDANGNGVVDDAERLANQLPSYYLSLSNATGNLSADRISDGTLNKVFTTIYRDKLDGIQAEATKNSSDAFLLDLTNSTGPLNADRLANGTQNRVYTLQDSVKLSQIQDQATKNLPDATLLNLVNATGLLDPNKIGYDATHRAVSDTEKAAWNGKQAAGDYATNTALNSGLQGKQNTLVSGVNIRTLGGNSLLGSTDIPWPSGTGDMNKSVYDPNNDGKIDASIVQDDATHRFATDTEKSTWNGKQAAGDYATNTALANGLTSKQNTLVSGVNLSPINGTSLLSGTPITIPIITVANNFTTTTAGSALDATKGKALNDGKVDKVGTSDITITDGTKGLILTCETDGAQFRQKLVKITNPDGSFSYTIQLFPL